MSFITQVTSTTVQFALHFLCFWNVGGNLTTQQWEYTHADIKRTCKCHKEQTNTHTHHLHSWQGGAPRTAVTTGAVAVVHSPIHLLSENIGERVKSGASDGSSSV